MRELLKKIGWQAILKACREHPEHRFEVVPPKYLHDLSIEKHGSRWYLVRVHQFTTHRIMNIDEWEELIPESFK